MNDRLSPGGRSEAQMNTRNGTYLLESRSASHTLIRWYAQRLRLTIDDVILLRAQLDLELRQHRLGIERNKKRPSAA